MGGFRPGTSMVVAPSVRLDTILGEADHVDVVKIDAEGFEMAVLEGLEATVSRMQSRPMTIFVECFPEALRTLGSSPDALYLWLKDHGFTVGFIDEGTRSITLIGAGEFSYGNWLCTTSDAVWRAVVDPTGSSVDDALP